MKKKFVMKNKLFFLLLIVSAHLFAQDEAQTPTKKYTFIQTELSVPLSINPNNGTTNEYSGQKQSFFIPDGLGSKIGYGLHYNKWIGLSAHTGLDWKITPKLVSVPVYGQLTISPLIGEELRFLFQSGFGHCFAIGRGKLSGNYYKIRLGITSTDDLSIFVDASYYGFQVNKVDIGSLSLGVILTSF